MVLKGTKEQEGKIMRKIFCLVMVCILVWGFVLASNVSAITKAKIVGTEWVITCEAKMYDSTTGDYLGAMVGGAGVMRIVDLDVLGLIAPLVMYNNPIVGANGRIVLQDYTLQKDKLISIDGTILIIHPTIGIIVDYGGPIETKIVFKTATTIKGKLTYTYAGVETVFKITGKKLGKLPAAP
jgi:hypothetical protein